MGKLLKFQEENEECKCEICDLVNEYGEIIQQVEDVEELHMVIAELISEAKAIGYRDSLVEDINTKMSILDDLVGECDCDEDRYPQGK